MIPYIERNAVKLMEVFRGIAHRVVAISSQDFYKSYGLLSRTESGFHQAAPYNEDSSLRSKLYPYRDQAEGPDDLRFNYDKIPIEQVVMKDPELVGTVLRLSKRTQLCVLFSQAENRIYNLGELVAFTELDWIR